MARSDDRLCIDVAQLRKGMYVAELDRPWTDLPTAFQGFVIEHDDQLRMLRAHCNHVHVDPERCAAALEERELRAAAASSSEGRPRARRPAARAAEDDGLDETRRHPDPDRLRRQVETAHRTVAHARASVGDALDRSRQGESVDAGTASEAVNDLIGRITQNPAASMLLSRLEERDDYTKSHSVNVCMLVLAYCLRARLERRQTEIIGLGTLLHDVGKARLPEALLNGGEPLAAADWETVRTHPVESERILRESGGFPRGALNIARMHHERRDGRGYPDARKQADLPGYVMLVALVNRYHSLTSRRPYRAADAPDRVLQALYRDADGLYGSRAVESFIRCVGIYPMGSLVELDNGALGVVVTSRPNNRLRPTVQLVRTPDGEPYEKLVLVNLAAEAERREHARGAGPVRRVRRVRTPDEAGIDPDAVIAESFGLRPG